MWVVNFFNTFRQRILKLYKIAFDNFFIYLIFYFYVVHNFIIVARIVSAKERDLFSFIKRIDSYMYRVMTVNIFCSLKIALHELL